MKVSIRSNPRSYHNKEKKIKLQKAISHYQSHKISIHHSAISCNVPYSTLRRALKQPSTTTHENHGNCVFTKQEEIIIRDAVMEFAARGNPLSRPCFRDLVKTFELGLPIQKQMKITFKNLRPGDDFVRKFVERHPQLRLKRRTQLEMSRARAMSAENLAKHFARLKQAYEKYNITSPSQKFNLDESGFSMRTASRARAKALFDAEARSNSIELKWKQNAQNVTVMPVVSADGRCWSPVFVLSGKKQKVRELSNGTWQSPQDFLLDGSLVFFRDPAGVDSNIFYK